MQIYFRSRDDFLFKHSDFICKTACSSKYPDLDTVLFRFCSLGFMFTRKIVKYLKHKQKVHHN